eukprot:ANDGO_01706.mRNA.1 hypothetical protein
MQSIANASSRSAELGKQQQQQQNGSAGMSSLQMPLQSPQNLAAAAAMAQLMAQSQQHMLPAAQPFNPYTSLISQAAGLQNLSQLQDVGVLRGGQASGLPSALAPSPQQPSSNAPFGSNSNTSGRTSANRPPALSFSSLSDLRSETAASSVQPGVTGNLWNTMPGTATPSPVTGILSPLVLNRVTSPCFLYEEESTDFVKRYGPQALTPPCFPEFWTHDRWDPETRCVFSKISLLQREQEMDHLSPL